MNKKLFKIFSIVTLFIIAILISIYGGIFAPVLAITYHDIYLDFRNYEVLNYNDIPIVLNNNTSSLESYLNSLFWFNYQMSICPSAIEKKRILMQIEVGDNIGNIGYFGFNVYLDCKTTFSTYYSDFVSFELSEQQSQRIKNALTLDDNNLLYVTSYIYDNYNDTAYNGIRIDFRNLQIENRFFYEFNTTYYFDYLALDCDVIYLKGYNSTILSGGSPTGNANVYLVVAYDSTDYYRLWNSDPTYNIARGRKKYNLDIGEKITAYGIGVGTYVVGEYNSAYYTKSTGVLNMLYYQSRIYLLNYSNTQQNFPGTNTTPDWNYDVCDAWDIPCHLGNALVYLAKDAPITSDIYAVVSNGWQFISNGFYAVVGLFGANFDSDGNLVSGNLFGILLMISLGVLIIVWGVGGDE